MPKKAAKKKAKSTTIKKKRATRKKAPKTTSELNDLHKEIVREKKKYGIITKGSEVGKMRVYDMTKRFGYGDKIDHPEFGKGIVKTVRVKKVEVSFPDRDRMLIHGVEKAA